MRLEKERLFVLKTFDVVFNIETEHKFNYLHQVRTALANALNATLKLPSIVLLIFDDLQVKHILSLEEEGINWLHWIIHEFRSAFQRRKDQLPSRAKGYNQAKIYLVKTPPKPHFLFYQIDQRRQFCALIDKITNASRPKVGTISVQTIKPDDFQLFKTDGTLSDDKGMHQYWLGIDSIVRNIDRDRRRRAAYQMLEELEDRKSNSGYNERRSDSRTEDCWKNFNKDSGSQYGHFHHQHRK